MALQQVWVLRKFTETNVPADFTYKDITSAPPPKKKGTPREHRKYQNTYHIKSLSFVSCSIVI